MNPSGGLPEEDEPDIYPDELEGIKSGEKDAATDSGDSAKSLSPSALAEREGNSDKAGSSTDPSNIASNLYKEGLSAAAGATPVGRLAKAGKLLGRNKKKGAAGGGVAILLVTAAIAGFGFLVSHELISLEQTMVKYEAKVEQFFEKKAASSVFNHIICRKLTPDSNSWLGSKCNKGDEADDSDSAESEADANNPLESEMDNFDITDPDVVHALESNGVKVNTDASGKFSGLSDMETGDPITIDDISNNVGGIFDKIETALPEWDLGQIKSFIPQMENDSGADFNIGTDEANDNIEEDIDTEVTNGVDTNTVDYGSQTDSSQNETAAQKQQFADGSEIGGTTGEAIDTALADVAKGDTEAEAVADASSKFSAGGNALLATTVANDACSVDEAATSAEKARIPEMLGMLVRSGTTIMNLASKLINGHLTGGEVNDVEKIVDGNPGLASTITGSDGSVTRNEAALPETASAAYQRETGGTVDSNPKSPGYNPDISVTSIPTRNTGSKIVDEINSVIPGGHFACSVLTSPIGGIISGLVGVVQIVSDIGSIGLAQVGFTAANIGVQELIQHVLIPQIIEYFTPIGMGGHEDSVQWWNNADAGTNIAFADYSRSLGGQPETNTTATQQFVVASAAENQENQTESLSNRLFAFSNPNSLVSHLAVDLPSTRSMLFSDISGYFENLPHEIGSIFSSLISARDVLAATPTQNPGEPYHITQYGFGNITADPVAVENYLYSNVSYGTQSGTRISYLGNPNQYSATNPDPSTSDVLHCFLQGYQNTANQTTGNNDPICGSLGSYDIDDDTPDPITANNVALSYCTQMASADPSIDPNTCANKLISDGQVTSKDIDYFSQYIMDTHVMGDYTSLGGGS